MIILTLWTWRHTNSLDGEDEDRIRELENNQESSYKAELTDLFLDIEGRIDEEAPVPDEMARSEFVTNVIERQVDQEELDSVIAELDKVGQAEEFWDAHKQSYKKAYKKFGRSAAIILMLGIVMAIFSIYQGDTFSTVYSIIYAAILFLASTYAWDGAGAFNEAREQKDRFEEMWREYKRV